MNRISMLALMLVVAGCIYVPPVWDIGDEIYGLDFIEPGVTTKDQVLAELGKPDTSYREGAESKFIYSGHKSGGGIFIGYGGIEIAPEDWSVIIRFDENDLVSSVQTKSWESLSEKYQDVSDRDFTECETADVIETKQCKNFRRQLRMACSGSKTAQYLVAQYYDRGEWVELDRVQALKWYSLAEQEWPEAIQYFKDKLRQEMTSSEIAEAERLAAEWKPNHAGCEQNGISSED